MSVGTTKRVRTLIYLLATHLSPDFALKANSNKDRDMERSHRSKSVRVGPIVRRGNVSALRAMFRHT